MKDNTIGNFVEVKVNNNRLMLSLLTKNYKLNIRTNITTHGHSSLEE